MITGSEKILVVDDDDTIRDIVSKMLCRLGFEVSSADSGEKGPRIVASLKIKEINNLS